MDWFDRVPKVELHLHLEGAIPGDALWELIRKYGGDPTVPDREALKRRFVYKSFPEFIRTWLWQAEFLREYEDFTFISEAVARDLAGQNIRYAEAFFSPPDYARHGLNPQGLAEAIRAGLSRVPETEISLVPDLVRDQGPEKAALTLAAVAEVRSEGVVGIGIGGSEHLFPPEPFAPVYEEARRLGLHTSAHAGEAAGPESVWGAIRALHVDRIGHGTRAVEDEALLDYLAETRIPVELCPLSNLRTGVIPSIQAHPVRRFFDRGLAISINSDDPKLFGNSLAEEYRLLEDAFKFTKDEIRSVILQSIDAAWLPPDRKKRIADCFVRDPGWREGEP